MNDTDAIQFISLILRYVRKSMHIHEIKSVFIQTLSFAWYRTGRHVVYNVHFFCSTFWSGSSQAIVGFQPSAAVFRTHYDTGTSWYATHRRSTAVITRVWSPGWSAATCDQMN